MRGQTGAQTEGERKNQHDRSRWGSAAAGIVIGLALGVALGIALDNVGVRLASGVWLGAGIGAGWKGKSRQG